MIPCLATVIVNRKDLLQRLIDSIDYPVGALYVVNNSDLKVSLHDIIRNPLVEEYVEVVMPEQIGCAGGWNSSISFAFDNRKLEYLLIFGNDVCCSPGDLEKIADAITPDTDFISANWAFSSWGITRKGFGKLGWLDENYYPAYLEDGDYWRRVQLSNATCVSVDTNLIHGEAPHWGSSTINSDPWMAAHSRHGHERNWLYHIRKWGGRKEGNTERFRNPFNDPSKPVWWWELSDQRVQQPHFRKNG